MAEHWTQADVDALKDAIKTGVLTVAYDGPPRRSITYQSATEMRATLALMQQAVNRANGGSTISFVSTSKGL